jgi:hypothetical protein
LDVADDHGDVVSKFPHNPKSLDTVFRFDRQKTRPLQRGADEPPNRGFVINHERDPVHHNSLQTAFFAVLSVWTYFVFVYRSDLA